MIPLHGIASRSDLPLPFAAVVVGAAIVLLITFYMVLFAWRQPKYEEDDGTPMPGLTKLVDARCFRIVTSALVSAIWLLGIISLFFGADRIDNPGVGFIYVWLWVGLVIFSLFLGHAYRATNPVRWLFSWRPCALREDRIGTRLPGAFALFAFLMLELVIPDATTLPVLRVAAVVWVLWLLAGAIVFPAWITRADPFEVYASTIARLSPWHRKNGIIYRMHPVRNLASWTAPRGTWAVAVVLLGGTAFDAMSNTPWWQRMTQQSEVPAWLLSATGLTGMVFIVAILYAAGCRLLRVGDHTVEAMDRFSPGLVPLIVGYCLSHYGTYLYLEGQRTAIRFNDPLGSGQNWFGFAEAAPDVTLFAFPTFVAWAQVFLIVGGHILGVLVTHDIALRHPPERIMLNQLPLLLVMVGFTVAGLLLMFGG